MVKPISARIKKSVFDILRPRLGGARVLDLYAGTGARGDQLLDRLGHAVVHDQRVARPEEVVGHRAAHDPQSDEPERCEPPGRLCLLRAGAHACGSFLGGSPTWPPRWYPYASIQPSDSSVGPDGLYSRPTQPS